MLGAERYLNGWASQDNRHVDIKIKLLAAAIAATMASAAQATVTIYTNQAAFAAALQSSQIENFANRNKLEPGLSFVSNAGTIKSSRFEDRTVRGGDETTFSFAGGVNGFGGVFDLSPGGFGQGLTFTLNLTGGGSEPVGQEIFANVNAFFGFISTRRFDSVRIRAGSGNGSGETYRLDNLQYGVSPVAVVPEPATWGMLVLGFGIVGIGMRKRNRNVVTA